MAERDGRNVRATPFLFLGSACVLVILSSSEPAAAQVESLKVLLVTGGCCHDYPSQTEALIDGLSERASLEWTVVHGPDSRDAELALYQSPDWADGFDVVVHNECYGGVTDVEYVDNIAQAHYDGVPAVMIHCSMHSYRNSSTDEWRKCVGASSYSHETRRPFTVNTVDATHPVMAGFPESWPAPSDELYKIEELWPEANSLATAYGQDTGRDHTVIWVNTYGSSRVFSTTLGHGVQTVDSAVFLDLLARGLLWTCDRLGEGPDQPEFVRGDFSGDGWIDISDAVLVLLYLFADGPDPSCEGAADSNDTGEVDLTDAVYLLDHLFLGSPPPAGPFPACGADPTDDSLTCESFQACE